MSQLILDIINYTQIELIEKQYKKTDLNVVVKKVVQDMKDTITEKNAIIDSTNLPELDVIPYQIQQLFTNLISNAIKYSRPDIQPEIKIDVQEATATEIEEIMGNPHVFYIKIIIRDNGIGFGREYENRIFDPFYRLHSHDEYQGSGIGLTLSKKIVENHKGFITVSSTINRGTTFNLYFPQH
ncbi:MAG: ATP-binding protein [Flavobacterium sp.]